MSRIDDILDFWFGRSGDPTFGQRRQVWFKKDPVFDEEIQTRFRADYETAASGALDSWQASATGCLALIVLLDQFPRNLFRNQPQAFATDAKALAITQVAMNRDFDRALPLIQRWFIYMPFMHSEDLDIQNQSVALFKQLADDPETESSYPYAIRHQQVIQQFGRFPHRNEILGRASTSEEIEFLKQPGSSF